MKYLLSILIAIAPLSAYCESNEAVKMYCGRMIYYRKMMLENYLEKSSLTKAEEFDQAVVLGQLQAYEDVRDKFN